MVAWQVSVIRDDDENNRDDDDETDFFSTSIDQRDDLIEGDAEVTPVKQDTIAFTDHSQEKSPRCQ